MIFIFGTDEHNLNCEQSSTASDKRHQFHALLHHGRF